MGVAGQTAPTVTGRFVAELKAEGEEKGQDKLDECLAIVEELRVGRFIVEIDREGSVFAWWFGRLSHVSSPLGWRLARMSHREDNMLKWQGYREKLRALPLNPGESELF
jgi:hypothetical protein